MCKHGAVGYVYIDNESNLFELVNALNDFDRVAIDTEADSLHSYYEKICLIQLSFDNKNYIVDPLLSFSIEPLLQALSEKTLILHGADYDLRMLRQSYGYLHKGKVIDTMIAAQILGLEKLGLASLIEKFFSIVIGKEMQKSNWSARPLTDEQLAYAASDTHFLLEICDMLLAQLKEIDRNEWFTQTCELLIASIYDEQSIPKPQDDIWRVKGYQDLEPSELRFLRAIWNWRESQAQKMDVPAFRILRTENMFRLSVWADKNPGKNIKRCRFLPKSAKQADLNDLLDSIEQARKLPEDEWPSKFKKRLRKEYVPENRKIVDSLRLECQKIADQQNLPLSVIISRSKLAMISKILPTRKADLVNEIGLLPWQARLVQDTIIDVVKQFKKKK